MSVNIYLSSGAKAPVRKHETDAGADIYSLHEEKILILPGERHAFNTGIHIEVPKNHYAQIAEKSGLALKHGIGVLGGVIDSGYRGEIKVILINYGKEPFTVEPFTRIAQLIIHTIMTPKFNIVTLDEFSDSSRGAGGFGSTGLK